MHRVLLAVAAAVFAVSLNHLASAAGNPVAGRGCLMDNSLQECVEAGFDGLAQNARDLPGQVRGLGEIDRPEQPNLFEQLAAELRPPAPGVGNSGELQAR